MQEKRRDLFVGRVAIPTECIHVSIVLFMCCIHTLLDLEQIKVQEYAHYLCKLVTYSLCSINANQKPNTKQFVCFQYKENPVWPPKTFNLWTKQYIGINIVCLLPALMLPKSMFLPHLASPLSWSPPSPPPPLLLSSPLLSLPFPLSPLLLPCVVMSGRQKVDTNGGNKH